MRVKQQMERESVLILQSPLHVVDGAALGINCVFQI